MRSRSQPAVIATLVIALLVLPRLASAQLTTVVRTMPAAESTKSAEENKCLTGLRASTKLFAIKSEAMADCFWQQSGLSAAKFATITAADQRSAAYVELVSDNMGPVRLGIGGSVTRSEGDSAKAKGDIEQFLGTGGNLVINVAYPAWQRLGTKTGIAVLLAPRIGTGVPALGADGGEQLGIADMGAELQVSASGSADRLGVIGQLRVSRTWASDTLLRELGATDNKVDYANMSIGLILAKRFVITWSRAIAGPSVLRADRNRVTVSIRDGQ